MNLAWSDSERVLLQRVQRACWGQAGYVLVTVLRPVQPSARRRDGGPGVGGGEMSTVSLYASVARLLASVVARAAIPSHPPVVRCPVRTTKHQKGSTVATMEPCYKLFRMLT